MSPSIPDALAMRALKYGSASDAQKDAVAGALRQAGRRAEALLLFEGRPEAPFLREELAWAVEHGVAFHLLALARLGVPVRRDDYAACAVAAEKAGRWMDARQCHVALEDAAGLARIAPHLPESLRPEPPAEAEEA